MDNQTTTRTILVKKADGNFTRVSLASVGRETKPVSTASEPFKPLAPALKPSTPLNTPSVAAAADTKSGLPLVPSRRANQVEAVLKKIKFVVPESNKNRLRALVQLYLKDIRTAAQTKEKALTAFVEGGLGLKPEEAEEIIASCDIIMSNGKKETGGEENLAPVPALKKSIPLPSNTTPFNSFKHGQPKRIETGNFKLNTTRKTVKSIVNDVEPATPREMGPLEEIKFFSLVDFRRLSAKPEEAAARLKQKFLFLKGESVLLFMQALEAWYLSPLYREYMSVVAEALRQGRGIQAVLGEDSIKMEEILALLKIEKELNT